MDKVKQPLAVTSKINADRMFKTPRRPVWCKAGISFIPVEKKTDTL